MKYPTKMSVGESYEVYSGNDHKIVIINGDGPPFVGYNVVHYFPDGGPGQSWKATQSNTLAEAISAAKKLVADLTSV